MAHLKKTIRRIIISVECVCSKSANLLKKFVGGESGSCERDQHRKLRQRRGRQDVEGGPHRQRHDRPRLGDGHDEDDRQAHQHHQPLGRLYSSKNLRLPA